jgi:molybdopterin converting factor small subunit
LKHLVGHRSPPARFPERVSNTVRVPVFLFAAIRESAGQDRVVVEVPDGATAEEVLHKVAETIADAADLIAVSRLAIDGRYVDGQTVIPSPECELALIPPVSGG